MYHFQGFTFKSLGFDTLPLMPGSLDQHSPLLDNNFIIRVAGLKKVFADIFAPRRESKVREKCFSG